ncbi:MAG: D-aminoacyl-tRNA deacylase [Nitrospiraceae bacterium]|nr:D-aminoacyl-tRNA deacylase [Nitrospiraceae bacterium]
MKALVQRVDGASVFAAGKPVSSIGRGLLVFLGVEKGDSEAGADYLAAKVSKLRVFEEPKGRMNLSVSDIKGGVLVVSQFTLAADTGKGNRPSFEKAEEPGKARSLYRHFILRLEGSGLEVKKGVFGADMKISLVNDGPVTILLESGK